MHLPRYSLARPQAGSLPNAGVGALADDQVIEHGHPEQIGRFEELLSQREICRAGVGAATGMANTDSAIFVEVR